MERGHLARRWLAEGALVVEGSAQSRRVLSAPAVRRLRESALKHTHVCTCAESCSIAEEAGTVKTLNYQDLLPGGDHNYHPTLSPIRTEI